MRFRSIHYRMLSPSGTTPWHAGSQMEIYYNYHHQPYSTRSRMYGCTLDTDLHHHHLTTLPSSSSWMEEEPPPTAEEISILQRYYDPFPFMDASSTTTTSVSSSSSSSSNNMGHDHDHGTTIAGGATNCRLGWVTRICTG
jgi:hypothetical protein